ncbi:MAG: DMT family transporter [Mycobacteriales bacterium]
MIGGGRGTWVRMGVLALLWGSTFLWIKLALAGLPPLALAAARCALGAATLTGLSRLAGQRLPRDRATWGHLVVAGLFCNAVPFVLFAVGERTVDSGVAGVLNATTPLWSLLIGLGTGAERGLRPVRLGGLVLGFAGTVLIFAPWQRTGFASGGAVALLAAAASYAVAYAYMARTLTGRGTAPLALSAAQLLAATGLTALTLPAAGLGAVHLGAVHLSPESVAAILVLGVFGTGVTFALNYRLIADEGPTTAATVGYLLPVVSVALGALLLGEPLHPHVLAGMLTVLTAVALTRPRFPLPALSRRLRARNARGAPLRLGSENLRVPLPALSARLRARNARGAPLRLGSENLRVPLPALSARSRARNARGAPLRLGGGNLDPAGLRIAEVEEEGTGEEGADGPGGEHSEAGPGAEREAVQAGGGLDGEAGVHRADLLDVALPVRVGDHGGDDREEV